MRTGEQGRLAGGSPAPGSPSAARLAGPCPASEAVTCRSASLLLASRPGLGLVNVTSGILFLERTWPVKVGVAAGALVFPARRLCGAPHGAP